MQKIRVLKGFLKRISQDHVSAYAAQAAYFLIMSFIPFVLFLTTIIRYTPLTYGTIRSAIISIVPSNLQSFVLGILAEIYGRDTVLLPLSAFFALWTSGKALQALINGFHAIYHVTETRNWLINRIYSVFYTFLFVVALVGSFFLLVLGKTIHRFFLQHIPLVGGITGYVVKTRSLFALAVLFLIFLLLYKVLPNRKASLISQVPGALLVAVAWLVFSYGFSLYFSYFSNYLNMYGSLTAVILLMLWVYICMNMVLYGAEINIYFEHQFREARKSVKEILGREK